MKDVKYLLCSTLVVPQTLCAMHVSLDLYSCMYGHYGVDHITVCTLIVNIFERFIVLRGFIWKREYPVVHSLSPYSFIRLANDWHIFLNTNAVLQQFKSAEHGLVAVDDVSENMSKHGRQIHLYTVDYMLPLHLREHLIKTTLTLRKLLIGVL